MKALEGIAGSGGKSPAWLRHLREEALSQFAGLSFPTAREEEWRYTNVDPILKNRWRFMGGNGSASVSRDEVDRFSYGGSRWNRAVFLDGYYSEELSRIVDLPPGVKLKGLREAIRSDAALLEPHLGRYAPSQGNAFIALNTAGMDAGVFLYFPKGRLVRNPLHLIFVSTSREEASCIQPRNLILAEEGSSATVIESYVSLGEKVYFTNVVTEVVLQSGAFLKHYKLQKESLRAFHLATTEVIEGRDSHYVSGYVSLGGALSRNSLRAFLKEEGGECILNGLYLAGDGQLMDSHTVIWHEKPRGTSRELYKGILSGRSKAVFFGKVNVVKDAQKTDSELTNKNLLLSEEATAYTRPQLEILADDVKCVHGGAVGQLEKDELFYLKSRGIPEEKASNLLIHGFAREVIDRIEIEPIRDELNARFLPAVEGEEGRRSTP